MSDLLYIKHIYKGYQIQIVPKKGLSPDYVHIVDNKYVQYGERQEYEGVVRKLVKDRWEPCQSATGLTPEMVMKTLQEHVNMFLITKG